MKLFVASTVLGILTAALSPLAMAQTATCYRLGNVSSCGIRNSIAGDNPAQQRYSSFNEVERLRDKNEVREDVRREQGLREEVGTLIAEGKCAEAKKTALRAGDFELADRAAGMCEPERRR